MSGFRKPFVPPTDSESLVVRTLHYGGEEHPATEKCSITVPVARLQLKTPESVHAAKLLAGTRWTPTPPSNSGIPEAEGGGEHGYIQISCDNFPEGAINLQWCCDALDRLVAEANVR